MRPGPADVDLDVVAILPEERERAAVARPRRIALRVRELRYEDVSPAAVDVRAVDRAVPGAPRDPGVVDAVRGREARRSETDEPDG